MAVLEGLPFALAVGSRRRFVGDADVISSTSDLPLIKFHAKYDTTSRSPYTLIVEVVSSTQWLESAEFVFLVT